MYGAPSEKEEESFNLADLSLGLKKQSSILDGNTLPGNTHTFSIPKFDDVPEDPFSFKKMYTVYVICVQTGDRVQTIYKRYREFRELDNYIREKIDPGCPVELPPASTPFQQTDTKEKKEERRVGLQRYLQGLSSIELMRPTLERWLGIPQSFWGKERTRQELLRILNRTAMHQYYRGALMICPFHRNPRRCWIESEPTEQNGYQMLMSLLAPGARVSSSL